MVYIFGVKVVIFSILCDVKGLLFVVIDDFDLVFFFESIKMYCLFKEEVFIGYFILFIGKVCVVMEGSDVIVICYGGMVEVV